MPEDGTLGESSIKIWEEATGNLITTLQGHNYWVDCVAFSSDGNYLISTGRDGLNPNINPKIILWNTSDWSMRTYYDEGLGNSAKSLCAIPGTDQYLFGNTNGELTLAQLPAVIPVELTSFTATVNENNVTLLWQTATETNNSGFEIHRSPEIDHQNWKKVGFVKGYGTTTEPREYSYVDDISSIAATALTYRLKQIDYNGSYEYSKEILVETFIPFEFVVEQNYPNPFNPTTTIKYQIPELSFVLLKVFNVLGNEVTTLVNEEKEAGSHQIEFDATTLPSGVYFYALQASSFVESRKMLLLK